MCESVSCRVCVVCCVLCCVLCVWVCQCTLGHEIRVGGIPVAALVDLFLFLVFHILNCHLWLLACRSRHNAN
jgi:hypothetical protein